MISSFILLFSFTNVVLAENESQRLNNKLGTPYFIEFPPGAPTTRIETKLKRYNIPYNKMTDTQNGKTYIYWDKQYNEDVEQIINQDFSARQQGGMLTIIIFGKDHYYENIQIWESQNDVWEIFVRANEVIKQEQLNAGLDKSLKFDTDRYIQHKYGSKGTIHSIKIDHPYIYSIKIDHPDNVNEVSTRLKLIRLPGKLRKQGMGYYYWVY